MWWFLYVVVQMLIPSLTRSESSVTVTGGVTCGGRMRGPYGVLQTPGFPHAFPVPLRCRWILEQEPAANGTISVYFTQQFTTSGLTFTEYMYYDDTYKLGERRAFTVTEENITRVKWLQVQSPVLVVDLYIPALEGTQLRALGLVNVFGLNMTYAIRPAPTSTSISASPDSCSALECRLLGHCYATHDYKRFFCSCFDGYTGVDCGEGPLCSLPSNMCQHGGICRQMGPAAVSCICAPGFTGDLCDSQKTPPECGIEECSENCRDGSNCDCSPKDSDSTSARFDTKIQIMDQLSKNTSQEIIKQLSNYLKSTNITLDDDIEIINVTENESKTTCILSVRLWSARRNAGAVRNALTRFTLRSRSDSLRLLPVNIQIEMQPALSIHALTVNQRSEVWEGSEFILSCTAYGSPNITFNWYKDGVKINFNGTTRDIWTRTVAEDALGRRIAVLGVSEAKQVDGGRWSCSADDAGRRRCRALWLTVLRPPDIRLLPSALTVNKGDNVSITCLAGASRVHGALGFSWARERNLLPLVPGREVWEDLYPAGSVLKLYNVQKSGEYRCQVSSVAGTNAKDVQLWVLGNKDESCEPSASHGLRWPRTAPGARTTAVCPPGHSGETTRFCEPSTGIYGVKWKLPDFSGCVADSLKSIFEQFLLISYGYSWKHVSYVLHQYRGILRSLPSHPGEGSIPLQHTETIIQYLLSPAAQHADKIESVDHLLKIFDMLLKNPDAFLDEEKTYDLQKALADAIGIKENVDEHFHEYSIMSKPVQEDNAAHFRILPRSNAVEEWSIASVGVELIERNGNATVAVVLYNNLEARLPSLRTCIEYKNGREMEYSVGSQQVQISASGPGIDSTLPHTVKLLFTHIYNYTAIASKLVCGLRSDPEPGVWSSKACEVRIADSKYVACRCRGLGTYALFTISRSILTKAEKDLRGVVKITAGIGGAMCLAVAALQLIGTITSRKPKLPILMKVATAATHAAATFTLVECDTKQEEACPGALGWICAACWCAGCAALCAQPLLLQAELAARAQNITSVALLAGVCVLCVLTARLWGGLPLQLGSAAQIVFAIGSALLLLLCLALAICAALRLRTITHKVPAERRNYLKDRQRIINHTIMLMLTTIASHIAGIAYVQPGERQANHVIVLASAAIVNGIAMVLCYVIFDEECMNAARRALFLMPSREWEEPPIADTSLSLYIKQSGEVESRGGVGVLESSSSQVSPITSYWQAHNLESSINMHRRLSTPDSKADIVRFVEYADCNRSRHLGTTRAVCDLVPRPLPECRPCIELGVQPLCSIEPDSHCIQATSCSLGPSPHMCTLETVCHNNCSLCTHSNPDVSVKPLEQPIKSCLKKSSLNQEFSSSISLPPMNVKEEIKLKSDIKQVNRVWNKAYDSPDSDKVMYKISSDLNFLLNKPQSNNVVLEEIDEAPT